MIRCFTEQSIEGHNHEVELEGHDSEVELEGQDQKPLENYSVFMVHTD